ncbi:NIL domain-containing protein [Mastigocladopsis repens]|uniref:NIL domain-containing protein n=1 Tax=Mastigocladopsis repens TaxID=221287 RepID=UPI00036B1220|nr:NIL domain-containing protein [Mastigocladopsis repens]
MVTPLFKSSNTTKIRLRLHIPQCYQQEPVISRLIATHGLVVNITGAMLGKHTNGEGRFDIEIGGTVPQISRGLAYLESLNLKIVGKPNSDGDGWY